MCICRRFLGISFTCPRKIWIGVNVRMIANWKTIKYSANRAMVLLRRIVEKNYRETYNNKSQIARWMRSDKRSEKYKKIESCDYCLLLEFLLRVDNKPSRLLWQHGNNYDSGIIDIVIKANGEQRMYTLFVKRPALENSWLYGYKHGHTCCHVDAARERWG